MLPGVRAVVRLGEAEAADPFAARQLRQVLLLLRLGAELVDRHHHERRLHAHHRAVAGVDALDLARDDSVADVVHAAAAVLLGDGRAEQAELAHLAEDGRVGLAVAEGLHDARRELLLAVRRGGRAHGALVIAELLLEEERVVPVEGCFLRGHASLSCSVLGWVSAAVQSGTTAVTSISTLARSSIKAVTSTAVMAMS
jgi:hypothetical protein